MARKEFRAFFEFQVELLADTGATIDPSDDGAKVRIHRLERQAGFRWSTHRASFEQGPWRQGLQYLKARIVPSMWQLTLSSNCRIYQNKTVLDIVKSVVAEYGLSMSDQTSESYKQLEYCTHIPSRTSTSSPEFSRKAHLLLVEHTDQDNKLILWRRTQRLSGLPISASFPYLLIQIRRRGRLRRLGKRVYCYSHYGLRQLQPPNTTTRTMPAKKRGRRCFQRQSIRQERFRRSISIPPEPKATRVARRLSARALRRCSSKPAPLLPIPSRNSIAAKAMHARSAPATPSPSPAIHTAPGTEIPVDRRRPSCRTDSFLSRCRRERQGWV